MARVRIPKRDGTLSQYFWNDKEPGDKKRKTVYRKSDDGIKRMRGVHFDAVENKMERD